MPAQISCEMTRAPVLSMVLPMHFCILGLVWSIYILFCETPAWQFGLLVPQCTWYVSACFRWQVSTMYETWSSTWYVSSRSLFALAFTLASINLARPYWRDLRRSKQPEQLSTVATLLYRFLYVVHQPFSLYFKVVTSARLVLQAHYLFGRSIVLFSYFIPKVSCPRT